MMVFVSELWSCVTCTLASRNTGTETHWNKCCLDTALKYQQIILIMWNIITESFCSFTQSHCLSHLWYSEVHQNSSFLFRKFMNIQALMRSLLMSTLYSLDNQKSISVTLSSQKMTLNGLSSLRRDLFLTVAHSYHTFTAQLVCKRVFTGTLDNLAALTKSFPLAEAKTR